MGIDPIKRRDFIHNAGKVAAGLALGAAPLAGCATGKTREVASLTQAASVAPRKANEKIRLGFIGVGGRGRNLMQRFLEHPEIEIKAMADVKKSSLAEAFKIAGPGSESRISTSDNYRDILGNPEIDAVVIATPDHWHAIPTIEACIAGKDVYVEKPLSLSIEEGRRMVIAARKHGRIVQLGTQQVSGEHYHQARNVIRGGELGKITMVKVWNFRNAGASRGNQPDGEAPPDINWDRWLGPRPMVPYNQLKASPGFRHFWDYAGGVLTDWGVHHFHSIMEIMDYPSPTAVSAAGGRYAIEDITTIPDNISVLYQFPTWTMEYSNRDTNGYAPHGSEYGIEFYGTTAMMFLDRKGYAIYSEADRKTPKTVGQPGVDNFLPPGLDEAHIKNFVACVRSRELPASDVEKGHHATTLAHLGNIAYRTGRQIRWDAKSESAVDNKDANDLLTREYRAPYLLPEV